jgi:hypothetical protein
MTPDKKEEAFSIIGRQPNNNNVFKTREIKREMFVGVRCQG